MTTTATDDENIRQYKSKFSLIVFAFASSNNLVIEVKNLSPNFKQIA